MIFVYCHTGTLLPYFTWARLSYRLPFSRGTMGVVVAPCVPLLSKLAPCICFSAATQLQKDTVTVSITVWSLAVSVSHREGTRTGNICLRARCILAAELKLPMSSLKNRWLIKVKYSSFRKHINWCSMLIFQWFRQLHCMWCGETTPFLHSTSWAAVLEKL